MLIHFGEDCLVLCVALSITALHLFKDLDKKLNVCLIFFFFPEPVLTSVSLKELHSHFGNGPHLMGGKLLGCIETPENSNVFFIGITEVFIT